MSTPGQYLERYTFEYLIAQALTRVPDDIDKREGSIIYDALAPACYELSDAYERFRKLLLETFAITATGENLDWRASEQGITRHAATYSVRKGEFTYTDGSPASIAVGSRFSTIVEANSINYYVDSQYVTPEGEVEPGSYNLIAETIGTIGNDYVGPLLPITNISNLATATLTTIITPARDVETDDELRIRYFSRLNAKSFGGNVAQYDERVKEISGVGEVQIYPTWNGGGTVKVSVIDAQYNRISTDFISQIQEIVDPTQDGSGLGTAPIGHIVTVTTPTTKVINVQASLVLRAGFALTQVQTPIEDAINGYLLELRKDWGVHNAMNEYQLAVFLARINAAIINVPGVANVKHTMLNGSSADITLSETALLQELPVLGTVVLNG